MATAPRARQRMMKPKASAEPPERLLSEHSVTRRTVQGFDCYRVTPHGRTPDRAVVYLHGGSYISEITSQHWSLISRLAAAGARVEVPIYGLAPRHSYREAYGLITAVYRDLLDDAPARVVSVMGDSAGGGLALGLVQSLRGLGLPHPGRLVLICPWLELTLSNPAVAHVERRDPWLSREGLLEAGRAWAGGDNPGDYRLSPLNGRMHDLPPVDLFIGTRDIMCPDVLRLRDHLDAAGVPVNLTVASGAFHDYVLAPVPEGRQAVNTILGNLR